MRELPNNYPVRTLIRQGVRSYRYYQEVRDTSNKMQVLFAIQSLIPQREKVSTQTEQVKNVN